MQNFIEVKNGNPGFQGAWLKPENLGLTEALISTFLPSYKSFPECCYHQPKLQTEIAAWACSCISLSVFGLYQSIISSDEINVCHDELPKLQTEIAAWACAFISL